MRALATARRRAVAVAGADGSEDVRALVRTLLDRTDGVVPVNRPAPVLMNLLGSDFDDPDDVEDYPFGGSYPPPRYPRMPWRRRY
jgi:hypothetical protein